MKAIIIYNKHDAKDRALLAKVNEHHWDSYVELIELQDVCQQLRSFVKTTPAIIPLVEDLQGSYMTETDDGGALRLISAMNKWMQKEREVMDGDETKYHDYFVKVEKGKSEEEMLMEMIVEGRI